jgi:AcrR family transcriptional regulator
MTASAQPLSTQPQPKPRRTQAERRASTRAALLDATIDALVEYGYSNVTSAQIVQRAGVSRGAQAHYFSTRAELVVEALRHLADRIINDLKASPIKQTGSEQDRYGAILDRLWELHHEPVFIAALELWVAARTDVELRANLTTFAKEFTASTAELALELMPERARRPEFRGQMELALSSMRGLAMHQSVDTPRNIAKAWALVRQQLVGIGS